jgi:hypothetical protein
MRNTVVVANPWKPCDPNYPLVTGMWVWANGRSWLVGDINCFRGACDDDMYGDFIGGPIEFYRDPIPFDPGHP